MSLSKKATEEEVDELLSSPGEISSRRYTTFEITDDSSSCSEDLDTSRTRFRFVKTIALLWTYFATGLDFGCFGPAVINLEAVIGTDFRPLAVAMTTGGVGVFGSIAGGAMIGILNEELFFGTSCLYLGVITALYPWAPNVYVFGALYGLNGFTVNALEAAGQTYPLRLWDGTRYRDPVYQALHATWTIAATLGPLVMLPFLVSIPADDSSTSLTYDNVTVGINDSITASNVTVASESRRAERVRYGFAIVGLVSVLVGVLFFIIFFIQGPSCLLKTTRRTESASHRNILGLLVMLLFFFIVYGSVEFTSGTFLSAMAVRGLGWDVTVAAWLATVYWGFLCAGGILAIPLCRAFSPSQMMVPSLALTALSFLLLSLFHERNSIVWFGTGMSGLGISWMYGSCVLVVSNYVDMPAVPGGISTAGISIGELVTSPLVGHLSESYSYLWIVYLCLIGSVTIIAIFVGMQLFVTLYPRTCDDHKDKG